MSDRRPLRRSELGALLLLALVMPLEEYVRWVTFRETFLDSPAGAATLGIYGLISGARLAVSFLASVAIVARLRRWEAPTLAAVWLSHPLLAALWIGAATLAATGGRQSWHPSAYHVVAVSAVLPALLTVCIALGYRDAGPKTR